MNIKNAYEGDKFIYWPRNIRGESLRNGPRKKNQRDTISNHVCLFGHWKTL